MFRPGLRFDLAEMLSPGKPTRNRGWQHDPGIPQGGAVAKYPVQQAH